MHATLPTIISIFFYSVYPVQLPQNTAPEDLSPRLLLSYSGYQNHFLLSFAEQGQRPVTRLYLYDFTKQRGHFTEDDRLGHIHDLEIVAAEQGFYLFESSMFRPPRLFLIDHQGRFKDLIRLESIRQWPEAMSLKKAVSIDGRRALLTFEKTTFDQPDDSEWWSAVLNFDTMQLAMQRQNTTRDAATLYFLPASTDGAVLRVNPLTSQMTRFEANKEQETVIAPARPLVPVVDENLRAIKKTGTAAPHMPSFLRFQSHISGVWRNHIGLSGLWQTFDKDGRLTGTHAFLLSDGGALTNSGETLLLWQWQNQALFFHPEEQILFVKHNQSDTTPVTKPGGAR